MLNKIKLNVLLFMLVSLPAASFALNPVIQTMYTADPAPMVHDGTLYLFSSHDEDAGEIGNFNLKNWVLATTTDIVAEQVMPSMDGKRVSFRASCDGFDAAFRTWFDSSKEGIR